jgi:hypothetical protein
MRFEIADTGDKEFLEFLEARGAFMRGPPIAVASISLTTPEIRSILF